MRRHLFRILLVMLLGVVTSVAVAWGCAWRSRDRPSYTTLHTGRTLASGHVWRLDRTQAIGRVRVESLLSRHRHDLVAQIYHHTPDDHIPQWSRVVEPHPNFASISQRSREFTKPDLSMWFTEEASGWPFLCLRCYWGTQHISERPSETIAKHDDLTGGIEVSKEPAVALSYYPILHGMLANTAIYGSIWWAILFGPGMVIRWRRRRAGRCAKCGYDLRGLSPAPGNGSGSRSDSVCPDCGNEQ